MDGVIKNIREKSIMETEASGKEHTMKKTLLVVTTLVFVFAFGSVFAADKTDSKASAVPSNGITYFDMGTASQDQSSAESLEQDAGSKPYNAVTYFDLGQPKSAKGSAAGGPAAGQAEEKKPYNGITAF